MKFINGKERKAYPKGYKGLCALCGNITFAITLIPLLFSFSTVLSQISHGGQPESFRSSLSSEIPVVRLEVPDLQAIRALDEGREKEALPHRIAVSVKAGISADGFGKWETMPDGSKTWRLALRCEGALAMSVCYDDFYLPEGCSLFLYDPGKRKVLGSFTSHNNAANRLFATELLPGDEVIMEMNLRSGETVFPSLSVSEISYVYRDMPDFLANLSSSDHCEVNVNCPEGENWQKQKRGVVRIYVKDESGFFWCSGSLVNNVLQNLEPFLLTADHCGAGVIPEDLAQWVFYLNYEGPGCENPVNTPETYSMTGATWLANANTSGSDFLLLKLNQDVPQEWEPYYNGWTSENIPATSGVCIHHPAGDIKKISTFTEPLISTQWGSTPNTHWEVVWSETANGWGVTEGGSSGSPLFDNNGMIVGTLTGGLASCDPGGGGPGSGPDKPDFYGKFSYSWDQNGSAPEQQLKYWLDPENSGIKSLPGMNAALTAAFIADETILLAGSSVTFSNLSSGIPISYSWTFEGGNPSTFGGKNPPDVLYPKGGIYDVSLVVSDGYNVDSLHLHDYIQVVGRVYPNPASDKVNIFLESELPAVVIAEVFNSIGQKVSEFKYPEQATRLLQVDVSALPTGIYFVRLELNNRYVFSKVLVYHGE
jgi:hypothetical protein